MRLRLLSTPGNLGYWGSCRIWSLSVVNICWPEMVLFRVLSMDCEVISNISINLARPRWIKWHVTSNSRPSGLAIDACPHYVRSPVTWVWKVLKLSRNTPVARLKTPCARRLGHVSSPEVRLRVITVFNYWSQSVLKPSTPLLNGVLKETSTDCTFSQTSRFLVRPIRVTRATGLEW
jgi:hypothetical protein